MTSFLTQPLRLSLFAKLVLLICLCSIVPLVFAMSFFVWVHRSMFWPGILILTSTSTFTVTVAYIFARHLTRPIRALTRSAEHVARGDFSVAVQIDTHDELQDLAVTFNRMCDDMLRFREMRVDETINEKAKIEGIVYSSEDGIILTDQEGHAQLLNPKASGILGLSESSREALAGRPIWSFVQHDKLAVAMRASLEGDTPKIAQEINLSADGIRRFYSISVSIINAPEGSSSSYWFVLILRNITAEKELDQLKDDFLQSLTHDLRSPMTAIRGYLQVLSEEMAGPVTVDQKKMLKIMENASTKLLHIVSNLLDTAKMSAGKLTLNLTECNLRLILPNTVEMFQTEAAKKKLTLTLDMPAEMTPLKLDPNLLERVITNLVANSIKFTREGGFVTIKFIELGDHIQGQVSDTGSGFPPEFMGRVFKKFEQVSGTRGGTGLGLAICKFIIDAHLGEITVQSKPGVGTTFTFSIPKGLEQNDKGEVYRIRPQAKAA